MRGLHQICTNHPFGYPVSIWDLWTLLLVLNKVWERGEQPTDVSDASEADAMKGVDFKIRQGGGGICSVKHEYLSSGLS